MDKYLALYQLKTVVFNILCFINSFSDKFKITAGNCKSQYDQTSLVILAMEQKETAYFNNLLSDNIELPIDITLLSTPKEVSTPSLLNSSPSESLWNTKTSSSNKSHITKIENCIDKKFNQAALKHLKFQILTEIKNDLDKSITNIKKSGIQNTRNNDYDLIRELRSHIQTLQSEVHFLREELKRKICLALIINNY